MNKPPSFSPYAFVVFILLSVSNLANALQIYGLRNTGMDDFGNVLSLHTPEPHYMLTGAQSGAYVVPRTVGDDVWAAPPGDAAWIGPNATNDLHSVGAVGVFNYTLNFDLTGINLENLQVSGLWAADNTSQIWLNGQFTGYQKGELGFRQLSPFVLEAGFLPGINSLVFRVENIETTPPGWPNPTGLLVSGLAANVVPEPSTPCLVAVGIALYLGRRSGSQFAR